MGIIFDQLGLNRFFSCIFLLTRASFFLGGGVNVYVLCILCFLLVRSLGYTVN